MPGLASHCVRHMLDSTAHNMGIWSAEKRKVGVSFDKSGHFKEIVDAPPIIRIQECDQIVFGLVDSSVSCGRDPLIYLRYETNPIVPKLSHHVRAAVRGTVVDDDQLKGLVALLEHRANSLRHKQGFVVERDDDGKATTCARVHLLNPGSPAALAQLAIRGSETTLRRCLEEEQVDGAFAK